MERVDIRFELNGAVRAVAVDPCRRALDVLREDLRLTGTKEGCGIGECGACTIVVDTLAVNACMMPAVQLDGTQVMTVEGLEHTSLGRALQKAFADHGAVQCGFCTPGMLLSAYALLLHDPQPTEAAIRTALAGNLCRCTGYTPIIAAVQGAAEYLRTQEAIQPGNMENGKAF